MPACWLTKWGQPLPRDAGWESEVGTVALGLPQVGMGRVGQLVGRTGPMASLNLRDQ